MGTRRLAPLVTTTMKVLEKIASPLGQRNLLFAAVCVMGAGAVIFNLLQSDAVTPPRNHSAERYQKPEFRDVVEKVDAQFAAHWKKEGLKPAPPADELTRIRRLSLGLTGTIPSLQEIRAFEKARVLYAGNQPPPNDHIQWWLSHLFEDRRTSDYLAERFARAYVGVENGPFLVYRRRRFVSWLSDQFHVNRPYDKVVRSLITAEGLWTSNPEVNFLTVTVNPNVVATTNLDGGITSGTTTITVDSTAGFASKGKIKIDSETISYTGRTPTTFTGATVAGSHSDGAQVNDNEKNKPDEVKLAVRMTRAFLGVRLDCVQCHNDRINDRWKQKDFHQLASFFSGANMRLSGIRETGRPYEYEYPGNPLVEVPKRVPFLPELLPEKGEPRDRLAGWVTHPDNRAFARAAVNRIWALMFGRPLVEPVDEIPLRDTPKNPYPPGLETLVDDFIAHDFDLQRLIRVIAATRVFGLDSKVSGDRTPLNEEHDQHWAAFALSRLRPEQVAGSIIQAASLTAIDSDSHILFRMARAFQQGDFIKRYGDVGEDEFYARGGTISQRLLMMNGELVHERIKDDLVSNAAIRILATARDDETVVEATYLAVLSRRPSQEEARYFVGLLAQQEGDRSRKEKQQDLYWALLNSTEFSWNH